MDPADPSTPKGPDQISGWWEEGLTGSEFSVLGSQFTVWSRKNALWASSIYQGECRSDKESSAR
jgi:hypothetical protein